MGQRFQAILSRYFDSWRGNGSPQALAILRIFISLFAILYVYKIYSWRTLSSYHEVSQYVWMPKGIYTLFDFPSLSKSVVTNFQNILWIPLLFSALGLFTRTALSISALFLFLYFSVFLNLLKPMMVDIPLLWAIFLLAVSPCADAFSIDVWICRGRNKTAPSDKNYSWPIRFYILYLALTYIFAALTKLKVSGLYWIDSDNLAFTILYLNGGVFAEWARIFTSYIPWVAGFVVLFEFSWILVFWRYAYAKYLFFPAVLFHLSCFLFLGILFRGYLAMHVFIMPLFRLGRFNKKTTEPSDKSFSAPKWVPVLFLIFVGAHLPEISGDVRKPFLFPFASYWMFAYPYLQEDNSFYNYELKFANLDNEEFEVSRCAARPLSQKHLGELLQKIRVNNYDQIPSLIRFVRDNLKSCPESKKNIIELRLYKNIWQNIEVQRFDRKFPDERKLLRSEAI